MSINEETTEPLRVGDLVELVGEPCCTGVKTRKVTRYTGAYNKACKKLFAQSPQTVDYIEPDGDIAVGGMQGWLLHPSCLRRVSAEPVADAKPEDWAPGAFTVWNGMFGRFVQVEEDGIVQIGQGDMRVGFAPTTVGIEHAKAAHAALGAMIRRKEQGQ